METKTQPRPRSVRAAAPAATARRLDLHVIPVDSHRLFTHWFVAPEILADLLGRAGEVAADHPLTLRLYRAGPDAHGRRELGFLQDYPAPGGWHEGFISLDRPAASVAAALGYFDAGHEFQTLVSTLPVSMPASPGRSPPPPPRPLETAELHPPSPAPAPPPAHVHGDMLDEAAILKAAGADLLLPLELRSLAELPAAAATIPRIETWPASRESLPETPALNEREVVLRVLRDAVAAAHEPRPTAPRPAPAPAEPASPAPAADRLASNFECSADAAPVRLEATLVLSGRLLSGHRLRIGDREIVPKPGGAFTCRHPLAGFESAWALLLHAATESDGADAPSLELLSRLPDADAPLCLRSCVEIEGELRDPAYVARLPRGITVNPAGRFRIVRNLPAAALLLPNLVVVADRGAVR